MIGVRHLGAALAQFDASTDDTAFASRQHAADIIVTRMKKIRSIWPVSFSQITCQAAGSPGVACHV